jgi:hypothetical protein
MTQPDLDRTAAAIEDANADGFDRVVINGQYPWIRERPLHRAATNLLESARAFDRLSLIIETAVRQLDPKDIGLQCRVIEILKTNREAIAIAEEKGE